ncbi:MAG: secD [Gammaproteobacteria bacterium]|nr:secD [Gammaproteobacteria bacterium]
MLNKYPLWKNLLLIFLTILGLLYSIPNIYRENPSIQITTNSGSSLSADVKTQVEQALNTNNLTYKTIEEDHGQLLVRFNDTDIQLQATEVIKQALGEGYTIAPLMAAATPHWMQVIGANPMKLGLDLSGGIHFLLDVDIESLIKSRLQAEQRTLVSELREAALRYTGTELQNKGTQIIIGFRDPATLAKAISLLKTKHPDLAISKLENATESKLLAVLSPNGYNNLRQFTVEQTMMILRNRVNELGVSEAIVQQQGATRIAVDLPGVQDATRAKQILGGTATLEMHLVDIEHDAQAAAASGIVPIGSKLYNYGAGPILLKERVILSGQSITGAMGIIGDNGKPAVTIHASGSEISEFYRTTGRNIGNPMAIVYIETKANTQIIDNKPVKIRKKAERIISIATINTALSNSFIVSNISSMKEAQNLALLLRAGALIAPIDILEERLIGPSLGAENIHKGIVSVVMGLLLVVIFMTLYYRLFGIVANIGLLLNLFFTVAIMSVMGAVLSLPGIAGMVLSLGMAVDANVLIFERIREELRNGVTPQAAIHAGFERAFSTIVDANVTTLIVAIALFGVGSGPIKGFAVTLTIGLLASMLTAITFSRALINWIYGGKNIKRLAIGIKYNR